MVTSATGIEPDSVQTVGNQIQVSSATLSVDQVVAAKGALNSAYAPPVGCRTPRCRKPGARRSPNER